MRTDQHESSVEQHLVEDWIKLELNSFARFILKISLPFSAVREFVKKHPSQDGLIIQQLQSLENYVSALTGVKPVIARHFQLQSSSQVFKLLCQSDRAQENKNRALFYEWLNSFEIELLQKAGSTPTVAHKVFGCFIFLNQSLETILTLAKSSETPQWTRDFISAQVQCYRNLLPFGLTDAVEHLRSIRLDVIGSHDPNVFLAWMLLQGQIEYPEILRRIPICTLMDFRWVSDNYTQFKALPLPALGEKIAWFVMEQKDLVKETIEDRRQILHNLFVRGPQFKYPLPPALLIFLLTLNEFRADLDEASRESAAFHFKNVVLMQNSFLAGSSALCEDLVDFPNPETPASLTAGLNLNWLQLYRRQFITVEQLVEDWMNLKLNSFSNLLAKIALPCAVLYEFMEKHPDQTAALLTELHSIDDYVRTLFTMRPSVQRSIDLQSTERIFAQLCASDGAVEEKNRALFYEWLNAFEVEQLQNANITPTVAHKIFGCYVFFNDGLNAISAQSEHSDTPEWARQFIGRQVTHYRKMYSCRLPETVEILQSMRLDVTAGTRDLNIFLAWMLLQGRIEYPEILRRIPVNSLMDAQWSVQNRDNFENFPIPAVGEKICWILHGRKDLSTSKYEERRAIIRNLFTEGGQFGYALPPAFISFLFSLNSDGQTYLSELITGRKTAEVRYESSGDETYREPAAFHLKNLMLVQNSFLSDQPALYEDLIPFPPSDAITVSQTLVRGVNVIGYALNELGIGECCRGLFYSLYDKVDYPVQLIAVKPSGRELGDRFPELEKINSRQLVGNINIFCLPLADYVTQRLKSGDSLTKNTYNICYAPWEFDRWLEDYDYCVEGLAEIWTLSRFTQPAFERFRAPNRFVSWMPETIAPTPVANFSRGDFGLKDGHFSFLFGFDFNSSIIRKNPFAVIAAFKKAFPNPQEPVQLVVKTISGGGYVEERKKLINESVKDPRIHIIDQLMEKEKFNALIQATDCFVSLHRSEGFGRILAEAMLLEKPVIATGFSGSADFLTPETGFPVAYDLIEVEANSYPMSTGLHWANPSVEDAARLMRFVFENPKDAKAVASRGRAAIENIYSPESTRIILNERIKKVLDQWSPKS